jgi:hypothetical protein
MLGPQANWVHNVCAAGGRAVPHHGGRHEEVELVEVPVECRAPLIRAFLEAAPGARPHVPVDRTASLAPGPRRGRRFGYAPDRASVLKWATDALDEVRREAWGTA